MNNAWLFQMQKQKGEETYQHASSPIQFNHRAFRLYGNSIIRIFLFPLLNLPYVICLEKLSKVVIFLGCLYLFYLGFY